MNETIIGQRTVGRERENAKYKFNAMICKIVLKQPRSGRIVEQISKFGVHIEKPLRRKFCGH